MGFWDDEDPFKEAHEYANETARLFQKQQTDECAILPELGDTVVLNARLLGMGHDWIRHEATVIAIGQLSYKVRFTDRKKFGTNEPEELWVHPAVITDVIRRNANERKEAG